MNSLTNLFLFFDAAADAANRDKSLENLWTTVLNVVNIVIWILVAILGIVLIVKGITTALAVVKAADEPQVRQEKISSFKYLAIGVGIALVISTIAGTLLSIFSEGLVDKITEALGKVDDVNPNEVAPGGTTAKLFGLLF